MKQGESMNVYEFGTISYHSKEWIVAKDFPSAAKCAQEKCDLVDLEDGGVLTIKMLTHEEMSLKKFDPDPEGTGEFCEKRAIPFIDAIKGREGEIPFLLCSYID
jgi:hypothetical protein